MLRIKRNKKKEKKQMTKTELIDINKRGYKYDNDLTSLLKKNPTILTA